MDATATSAAGDPTRMPRHVRRVLWGTLAVIGGLAVYLLVVRGTAIIYDLGRMGAGLLCL